ncbi:signal peptidase II [Stella sp.]|uniref:signal peptidase II n=1 Tax=Stella sp. TaxID=2912054 RepID=UPI0035B045ED
MSRAGAGLAVAAAILAADQASKHWMLGFLQVEGPLGRGRFVPLTDFLNLVVVWNRGVSFGMFAGHDDMVRWALAGLAVVVSMALAVWLFRTPDRLVALGLGCVIGGAIGNVVDRVRFGAVFDFLDFHAAGYHWPAFNVADAGIFVGVVALLADGLFRRREGHT